MSFLALEIQRAVGLHKHWMWRSVLVVLGLGAFSLWFVANPEHSPGYLWSPLLVRIVGANGCVFVLWLFAGVVAGAVRGVLRIDSEWLRVWMPGRWPRKIRLLSISGLKILDQGVVVRCGEWGFLIQDLLEETPSEVAALIAAARDGRLIGGEVF